MKNTDFVSQYMEFANVDNSEAPPHYHRWTCLSIMAAALGRNIFLQLGHSKIYPNLYALLMGSPGTRKGTAMGIGRSLLKASGFGRFAADKTSKERFLMDMRSIDIDPKMELAELEALNIDTPAETYIMSGEFTDFIGQGNMEFVTMLTNLWDNLDYYENPKIHGKSVKIDKPTVNLFGGNTVSGFALAFPPEALGNGFLSRVILIHGESTGVRIPWPEPADELMKVKLADWIRSVRKMAEGEMHLTKEAKSLGAKIYGEYLDHPIDDVRFSHYGQRRFIHLLKLAMIIAIYDHSFTITDLHLRRANTVLVNTERKMPLALGEYGKNRNSDVASTILEYLGSNDIPRSVNEIYKRVGTDITKMSELAEILQNLKNSEKITVVTKQGKQGYLRNIKPGATWDEKYLDPEWLHLEEYA